MSLAPYTWEWKVELFPIKQAIAVFFLSGSLGVLALAVKMYLFPIPKLPEVLATAPYAQVAPQPMNAAEPFLLTSEAQEAKEKVAELRAKAKRLRIEAETTDKEAVDAERVAKAKEEMAAKEIEQMEALVAASKNKLAYQPIPRQIEVKRAETAPAPKLVEKTRPVVKEPPIEKIEEPDPPEPPVVTTPTPAVKTPTPTPAVKTPTPPQQQPAFREFDPKEDGKLKGQPKAQQQQKK
jgi:hypothetical protein